MLFKSLLLSQASGSIAGAVFSHNGGGMYMRARATPTNPNTSAQQAVRNGMAAAVFAWSNTLTNAQRENWNTYAFNTPTLNRLGESTHKTGQQMFIRGAVPRIQAGLSLPVAAPTSFDVGDFTMPAALGADASTGALDGDLNPLDEWALQADAFIFVYQSRPQNATRTFGKGPYQLGTIVEGAPLAAPINFTYTSLFPMAAGQRMFFKFNVSRPDGRWSNAKTGSTVVVP